MSQYNRSGSGLGAVCAVVAAVLVTSAALVGVAAPAAADGGHAPVDDVGDPGSATYVNDCGTLDRSGVYVLQQDVSAAEGDCLRVTADDVTLLAGGHTVAGGNTSGSAIVAEGVTGLHVEGFTLVGTWNGITLADVEDARVTDVRVRNATGDGVRVWQG